MELSKEIENISIATESAPLDLRVTNADLLVTSVDEEHAIADLTAISIDEKFANTYLLVANADEKLSNNNLRVTNPAEESTNTYLIVPSMDLAVASVNRRPASSDFPIVNDGEILTNTESVDA